MKYVYECELDYPDCIVYVYSDEELTQEELLKKAIEKMTRKTMLYKVARKNQDTGNVISLNEIKSETGM